MSTDPYIATKCGPGRLTLPQDGMGILMTTPGKTGSTNRGSQLKDPLKLRGQKMCSPFPSSLVLPFLINRNQVAEWQGQGEPHHSKWPGPGGTLYPCEMAWGKFFCLLSIPSRNQWKFQQHQINQADKNNTSKTLKLNLFGIRVHKSRPGPVCYTQTE